MKLLVALPALAAALNAAAQAPAPGAIPTPVHDWGCEVLLCLADPRGPTTESQCVDPIRRLWRHLARGGSFPSCRMAQGPHGKSYAAERTDPYQPCPDGTATVPYGQRVELTNAMPTPTAPPLPSGQPSPYSAATPGTTYFGIGDGAGQSPQDSPMPKLCAAGWQGQRRDAEGDNDSWVNRYDTLYVAPPQSSGRAIDVFIDDKLWQTVRW